MNIAILSYHRIGGSGIIAYEIGRAMAEDKGHNVHFIGLEPPFRLKDNVSDQLRFHKVCVKEYPVFDYQPYTLALASQLSEIIRRCKIDIIHSHYALPHAISAILAKDIAGNNSKCITTLHGTDITIVGSHPGMANITKYAIEKSDAVTTVSDFLTKETEEKFNIASEKIQTIYNFINPAFFNPSFKQEKKNTDKITLLHISNLRAVKSPIDVIKILAKLRQEIPDREIQLNIIGEGPMKFEMMQYADKLKIHKAVNFVGSRSELGPEIANSDLFILPSKSESFGLVALEAMACGVPVLASRVGGLPEVIRDGVSGALFEFGHIDEAVDKARKIVTDNKYREQLIQNSHRDVHGKFAMEKIIGEYETLYLKALNS